MKKVIATKNAPAAIGPYIPASWGLTPQQAISQKEE